MEISKTTIKVQCSLNYQVASMEAEIANFTNEELESYTQYLVDTCTQTVKSISNAVGPTHTTQVAAKPVVQTQVVKPQQSSFQARYPQKPAYQPQPASGPNVRYASEKQIQYLQSFGYTGETAGLTFADADRLLKQYKAQNGIQ